MNAPRLEAEPGTATRRLLWRRYATVLVLLLAGTLLAVGGTEMVVARQNLLRDASATQQRTATDVAYALRLSLGVVERQMASVALLPWDLGDWLGIDRRREEFHRLLLLVPALVELRLLDEHGTLLLRVSRRDPDFVRPGVAPARGVVAQADATPSDAASAASPAGSAAGFSPSFSYGAMNYVDGYEPRMDLVLKITDRTAGRTEATLGLRGLARELHEALSAPGLDILVVDSAARVVLHAESAVMLAQRRWVAPDAQGHGVGLGGEPVLSAQAPVPGMDWQVVVQRPIAAATAPLAQALLRTAAFTAAALLLALGVSLWMARRMARPIDALVAAANRMGSGDLGARINLHTNDELEDLANQFNRMAGSLQASVSNLEDKVAAKTLDLQRVSRHKSEFLANMSHELRTPLNAILGFADVLQEGMAGPLNDEQREYVGDIHASGLHLLALINDVLDLSKIEAGQLALELADFDVAEILLSAAALMRQRCVQKGVSLSLALAPELGVWRGDARRIKQVVLNLLSNAMKFTPEGGAVALSAGLSVGLGANEGLWIAVQDNGVGIDERDHAAVFDEFVQVGTDPAGRAQGTGLGLALARRLVRQHGGEITLASALGVGTTLRFNIPASPSTSPSPQPTPLPAPEIA